MISWIFFFSAAVSNWFGSSGNGMGFSKFISLSDLNKAANGYIRNNAIRIEVEIEVSMIRFSS